MDAPIIPDQRGAPLLAGDSLDLELLQYTEETKPAVVVIFDNVELRAHEVRQAGIERAVQLPWAAPTGINYAVEGGPPVHGPWVPVNDVARPGVKQMTVPANDAMKVCILRQAP